VESAIPEQGNALVLKVSAVILVKSVYHAILRQVGNAAETESAIWESVIAFLGSRVQTAKIVRLQSIFNVQLS
jgi:hypothetical protein